MKQTTTKEKIEANKRLTDHRAVMFIKDFLRPLLNVIASTRIPYKVEKIGNSRVSQEREAIKYSVKEYPTIDWEYEQSCIFRQ